MKFFLTITQIVLLSCFFAFKSFAQNDEASLKAFILAFNKAQNAYSQNKNSSDKLSVMRYYDKNYTGEITFYPIKGNPSRSVEDYRTIANDLDKKTSGIYISTHADEKFLHFIIKGDVGVVSMTQTYKVNYEGSPSFQADAFVTLVAKKVGSSWKILSLNSTVVEEERQRGACVCTLFEGGSSEAITKISIPGGTKYITKVDNFVFTNEVQGILVSVSGQDFLWENNKQGDVFMLNSGDRSSKGKKIGTARNQREVIIIILKEVLYQDNCTEVIMR